jgi:membrane peptidoglycan carboxypeptidase
MKLFKKILKILLILLFIFFIIVFIDLKASKINSVEDISNLTKVKMYDRENRVFYEINNLHESSYVRIEDINENIIKTIIEIEDKRFYKHKGFDLISITKAFINNISGKPIMGGSTITQQYVKNIYLSNEKSLLRKIRELYFAVKIESIYTKEEILEGYLNTIYFNHGIYGIFDACKYYFNKTPDEISLAEASTLIAIIKSPATYSPVTNLENNTSRKEIILKTLLNNNKITEKEYNISINEEIIITKTKYQKYSNSVLFYKDIVLDEIKKTALKSRNFDIYTSFDIDVNNFIDTYINDNPILSDLAIVVLDNNANIVAATSINYKYSTFNPSTSSLRMIGSAIKPMLYYEALNYGMSSISKFKSEETIFYINKKVYEPKNFNNKYENKKITMAYALATSDNIYAVKTHLYIGSNKLISFLNKFDVESQNYPSLALGTAEMSLLKLTSIYNTFSRLGVYSDPKTINYINSNNKRYSIKTQKDIKLLNPSTSFIINELLTNTFDTNLGGSINVTGYSIADKLNVKASAKTGLTDYDSYMIGYTPIYSVGIWTGNIDNSLHTDTFSKNFPKQAFLHIINYLSEENKNIWYDVPNDVYSVFTTPTGFNNNYLKLMYFKR